MDNKISSLFDSPRGKALFGTAVSTLEEFGMKKMVSEGVLVGLSGGADSVMLLLFLLEYRKRTDYFPILAVHINHSIRGESADNDEKFSRDLCKSLNVEFLSEKIDVPAIAKEMCLGIEECARNVRYNKFKDIISGRNDIRSIAVAHNADDNLETVLLNIFRGSGLRGACGIPPVRNNIFRPLLRVKKADILELLCSFDIVFVTDETNNETEYRRNYIRHEIVPKICNICDDPAAMVSRLSTNLRHDDEYISFAADNIIGEQKQIEARCLVGLHRAVLSRALIKLVKNNGADISSVSVDAIINLLSEDNFSWSLPGGATFVCERGLCSVRFAPDLWKFSYDFKITVGMTELEGFDSDFYLSNEKIDKTCLNVYKISIQADISSAIIVGDLYLRPRCDGDTIYYGGMTRKVKKLFSDHKIPNSFKDSIPLLCDDNGVVWVPGLGVRDDGNKSDSKLYVCLAIGKGVELSEKRMRTVSEFKKN